MDLVKSVNEATVKLQELSTKDITQETQDRITKLKAHLIESRGDPTIQREYVVKTNELLNQHSIKPKTT
jgi:hypothetical protein